MLVATAAQITWERVTVQDQADTGGRRLARRYLAERQALAQIRPQTAREWAYILAQFADEMPDDPGRVDKRHVLRWVDAHPVAPSTLRKKVSVVRGFLDWCVTEKVITRNPIRVMGFTVKTEPNRIPRALSAKDASALWDVLPDARARCIVALGLQLGLRRAEIATIEIHDIDWAASEVRVTGKGDKERVVPLTATAIDAIREYLAASPASDGPLVRSHVHERRPLAPPTIGKLLHSWFSAAGLKHHPYDGRSTHALRHTAASDVLERCGDITIVRDMLGHSSTITTQIYTRSTTSPRLREAMEGRNYAA